MALLCLISVLSQLENESTWYICIAVNIDYARVCVCVCVKMCVCVCVCAHRDMCTCMCVCLCLCVCTADLNAVTLSSHGSIRCISEEKADFPSYVNFIVY